MGTRGQSPVSFSESTTLFAETTRSLTKGSLIQLGCLESQSQESTCLWSWDYMCAPYRGNLSHVGSRDQASYIHGKHFTDSAISIASEILVSNQNHENVALFLKVGSSMEKL